MIYPLFTNAPVRSMSASRRSGRLTNGAAVYTRVFEVWCLWTMASPPVLNRPPARCLEKLPVFSSRAETRFPRRTARPRAERVPIRETASSDVAEERVPWHPRSVRRRLCFAVLKFPASLTAVDGRNMYVKNALYAAPRSATRLADVRIGYRHSKVIRL